MNFLLTLLCALIGGFLFLKYKVPGGVIVGAVFISALMNVIFQAGYMPLEARVIAQIIAGAYIACSVNVVELKQVKKIIKPSCYLLGGLFSTNLIVGFIVYQITDIDLLTALFAAIPGGLSNVPLIAADVGADMAMVATIQIFRLMGCLAVMPILITIFHNRETVASSPEPQHSPKLSKRAPIPPKVVVITLVIAVAGGLIGRASGIPAGTMLFALVAVLCLKLWTPFAGMPLWLRRTTQVLSGAYIGCSVTREVILRVPRLFVPVVIVLAGYVINCVLCGYVFSRFWGYTKAEGMLAATPAGSSDMALMSADMGLQSTVVLEFQIVRVLAVNIVFSQILLFISKILVE
ncbi:MAG: AbrB family transcriptional regulator [Christensenellales bacterium]